MLLLLAAGTFGVLYYTYDSPLPNGRIGSDADALACHILEAIHEPSYLEARYVEWNFGSAAYKLDKRKDIATCQWSGYFVELHFSNSDSNSAFKNGRTLTGKEKQKTIEKATQKFNNDSFWVLAPFKLFDEGTTRKLVELDDNSEALLITYTSGGSTPGDSYLWIVYDMYVPTSFKMWVSIIPIGGFEAKWGTWKDTDSGAKVAREKSILGIELPITHIKIYSNPEDELIFRPLRDIAEEKIKPADIVVSKKVISKKAIVITNDMRIKALNRRFSKRRLERDINFIRPILNEKEINIMAENIMLLQQTSKNIYKMTYKEILALRMRDSLY